MVEGLRALMENGSQQAVVQLFGHLFFLLDPGDVFEIKFQMALHVRVERRWRYAPFVFIRVTFQFFYYRRIFRDGNGRVVLNRYSILEMGFPDGKSRFVFYLVEETTHLAATHAFRDIRVQ